MVRKFVQVFRYELDTYSMFIAKQDRNMACYMHGRIMAAMELALELGIIPCYDYFDYLLKLLEK